MHSSAAKWRADFEAFDYGSETPAMTLDEAVRESARLSSLDKSSFYRVVADSTGKRFRVKKVPKSEAYKEYQSKFRIRMAKVRNSW
jgi:hypothetical protein